MPAKQSSQAGEAKRRALRACEQRGVRFIQLWLTDILGQLKSLTMPSSALKSALDEGVSFDGSSVEGFARIHDSDLVMLPDPLTFRVLPWTKDDACVSSFFCDVVDPHLKPYECDPRQVLRRVLGVAKERGLTVYLGPELEYFYFAGSKVAEPLDAGGYFDLTPIDAGTELREKTVIAIEAMGVPVHATHHEVATSQHELDLHYDEALKIADAVMTTRLVIKEIARQNGVYATFMPKPIKGQNGSGMHVHQSLFRNGRNVFHSRKDRDHLSAMARFYIAGLLKHAREIALVTNQWVNSYKRLVAGFEAPVYVCWDSKNRSALVRVPLDKPDAEEARRVEFRCPDPAFNPYLAFAAIIGAGLKGIEEEYELPDPIELDVYLMGPEERSRRGIACLPDSLQTAIEAAAGSKLMREILGDVLLEKLLENKRIEWDNYRTQVTDYEIARYLPIL